jgi:hypothetical protein
MEMIEEEVQGEWILAYGHRYPGNILRGACMVRVDVDGK